MISRKHLVPQSMLALTLALTWLWGSPVHAGGCDTRECQEHMAEMQRYAERGNLDAMVVVAVALATGEGLEKDEDRARQLIREAIRLGSGQAAHIKSGWRRSGITLEVDEERARALLDRAVQSNYAPAQYERGIRTLTQGVEYLNEGLEDIAAAADEGYEPAQYALARLLEDSAESPADLRAAGEYYSMLAVRGYRDSRSRLRNITASLQMESDAPEDQEMARRFGEVLDMEVITVFGVDPGLDNQLAHMNERLRHQNLSRIGTGTRLQRTRPCALDPACDTIFEQGAAGNFADTVSSILGM